MLRTYSKDLRLRVVVAVDRGIPRVEVVRLFSVSASTVRRDPRLRHETGNIEPNLVPGPRPSRVRRWSRHCPTKHVPTSTLRWPSTASSSRKSTVLGSRPPR